LKINSPSSSPILTISPGASTTAIARSPMFRAQSKSSRWPRPTSSDGVRKSTPRSPTSPTASTPFVNNSTSSNQHPRLQTRTLHLRSTDRSSPNCQHPRHLGASSSKAAIGPCGHGVDPSHRRFGSGGSATLNHLWSKVSSIHLPTHLAVWIHTHVIHAAITITSTSTCPNPISLNFWVPILSCGSNSMNPILIYMIFLLIIG